MRRRQVRQATRVGTKITIKQRHVEKPVFVDNMKNEQDEAATLLCLCQPIPSDEPSRRHLLPCISSTCISGRTSGSIAGVHFHFLAPSRTSAKSSFLKSDRKAAAP
jgi:hypothetical protein